MLLRRLDSEVYGYETKDDIGYPDTEDRWQGGVGREGDRELHDDLKNGA